MLFGFQFESFILSDTSVLILHTSVKSSSNTAAEQITAAVYDADLTVQVIFLRLFSQLLIWVQTSQFSPIQSWCDDVVIYNKEESMTNTRVNASANADMRFFAVIRSPPLSRQIYTRDLQITCRLIIS